jgi:hypothetical protein
MKIVLRVLKWIVFSAAAIAVPVILLGIFVVAPRIKSKSESYHSTVMASYRAFLVDVGPGGICPVVIQ